MGKRVGVRWGIAIALVLALAAALATSPLTAPAAPPSGPPQPELDAVLPLERDPCVYEGTDRYEKRQYKIEGWKGPNYERYPGLCERLRFAYGPIVIEPGKNNVLVEPITIQSPRRDGYMTRFEPNLVLADGSVPPVERVHLHHGTWLSSNAITDSDFGGLGPFMAAGEEKTIGSFPTGYGMPIQATELWFLLYMVHSAVPTPMVGYITYDIDFIPKAKADEAQIKPAYPFWLDVRPSAYPVFNVQRQFGDKKGTCTWPDEQCANFDPWGEKVVGQGMPGQGHGTEFDFPEAGGRLGPIRNFTGGTLIGLGGHLHPGGLRDHIDLVRDGRSKRIFNSEALYWKRRKQHLPGGPPTSWDMSMTVTGLPFWGVKVKPNDILRISATYDTKHQSSYEDMGIAIGAIAPDRADGSPTARGLNPFKAPRDRSRQCRNLRERIRGGARKLKGFGLDARRPKLCARGIPTHGHQAANGNYGYASGDWDAPPGPTTRSVNILNFQYGPGDLSTASTRGVPQVPLGTNLQFNNLDGALIYHTITTCRFPCKGPTGAAFPIADGQTSTGRNVDLDSSEMGLGTPFIGPATNRLSWTTPVTREAGYKPGEVVTYFCRIHPFMRGAFQVSN
jgi:hypothetical protein